MATYWVYNAHAGAGDAAGKGGASTTPFATLKYCIENANGMGGAPNSGDIIYVDYRHQETYTGSTGFTFSSTTNWTTVGEAVYVVSVDFDNATPSTYRKMTTGYLAGSSGTSAVDITAWSSTTSPRLSLEFIGIRFNCYQWGFDSASAMDLVFRDCDLYISVANGQFWQASLDGVSLRMYGCNLTRGGLNYLNLISTVSNVVNLRVVLEDCVVEGNSTANLFAVSTSSPKGQFYFDIADSNLTAFSGKILDMPSSGQPIATRVNVHRSKVSSSLATWDYDNDADYASSGMSISFTECSHTDVTATQLPVSRYRSASGVVESDSSSYYTSSPGSDGENSYSIKLTPTTSCNPTNPLTTVFGTSDWHPGGNANLTLRFSSNDSALTDEDVWLEISSPGHTTDTGSATIGRFTSTRPAFGAGAVADTSPLLLTDTDASWTGGGTSEYKFVVPINATEPGSVDIRFNFGKSSTTPLYVSTNVDVS